MKKRITKQEEKELTKSIVELGESSDPKTLDELVSYLDVDSFHVRRLAVSAIGKLSRIAGQAKAVTCLIPLLRDDKTQVRQYTIKALSAYGKHAKPVIPDLQDIASSQTEKDYNRENAQKAINIIQEACSLAEKELTKKCKKCGRRVEPDEYSRSMKAFDRIYCDHCFDEVYLKRRNFDTKVELNKNIIANDGTLVQSDGERIIANFLHTNNIKYRYDERMRIIEGYAIRPDFYLPEFDIYIEYWGMNTIDYKIGMLMKRKLYQQQEKKLVSVSYKDKPRLTEALSEKLSRYFKI